MKSVINHIQLNYKVELIQPWLLHHLSGMHSTSGTFHCWLSKTAVGYMAIILLVLFMHLLKLC